MKIVDLLICLLFTFFFIESQQLYTRHKYDRSDYRNHLSKFFQSLNEIFTKKNIEDQVPTLIEAFLKTEFNDRDDLNPINFYDDLQNDGFPSEHESHKRGSSGNRIAECILSEDENFEVVSQKFYMPLKDASVFAKNFEKNIQKLSSSDKPFKVLNVTGNDSESESEFTKQLRNLRLKCTPVESSEISETCKACLYFEEVVFKRHFRFGHISDCAVLECMNGFDKKLVDTNNKGYFFLDFVKFHPICLT